MTVRFAIVDDEQASIDVTSTLVSEIDGYTFVGSWNSPKLALREIDCTKIDLLFLDVEMPQLDGLSFLRELKERPVTILVTAHKEYAVDAFALGVRDYMLKPVSRERLRMALENVEPLLTQNADAVQQGHHLAFKKGYENVLVDPDDVLLFESDGNFSQLTLSNGSKHLISESLRSITERLSAFGFVRLHRSFVVNVSRLAYVSSSSVRLDSGHEVPVGRAYRDGLRNWGA